MSIKVKVPEKIEKKFRKSAMSVFGYSKGSLSKAAEKAFASWIASVETTINLIKLPKDPVKEIRGLLKGVEGTSVELQHKALKYRSKKTKK